MKVGYPDTINNKAYQGEKSPFKMVDKSKADLDKDGKVSDYEENRAEAAFGDAPLNYSPIKAKDIVADNQAKRKAIAEKAKKAEAAIRESESSSKSSEPTAEPAKKKTKLGRAIQARKERRAKKNPKVKERQEGNATRKKNKKDNKYAIKTQKSLVTKERQDKKTEKAVDKQTKRLKKVTNKVVGKVADVKSGGLGIDQAPRNRRKTIAANKVAQEAYIKKRAEDKKKKSFKGF
jgi:hypothetical protein